MVSELTRPVDPEFATNYELGLKFENEAQPHPLQPDHLLHGVRGCAARGEHHHDERLRRDVPGDGVLQRGRGGSEGRGTRVPGAASRNAFRIRAQASYLDAEYTEFQSSPAAGRRSGDGGDDPAVRRRLLGPAGARARRSSWARSRASIPVELGNGGALEFTGEYYHEDENLFYISAAGRQYDAYLDEKNLLNASVTYTADGRQVLPARVRQEPDGRALPHCLAVGRDAVDAHAVGRTDQLRRRSRHGFRQLAVTPSDATPERRRPAQAGLFYASTVSSCGSVCRHSAPSA